MDKKVQEMLKNSGVYIAGDTNHPEATIVLVSWGGKIYSTIVDQELDPERFFKTLTLKGPFVAG